MKTMEKLSFGVPVFDCQDNIIDGYVIYELLVKVSSLALFIRDFEEKTETHLLYRETINLEPFYHQLKFDI